MSKIARALLIIAGILAFIVFSLFLWVTINRPETKLSKTVPQIDLNRTPRLISAFFGLDNSLPWLGILISRHAPGNDGMPLVFSHEIDPSSLDKTDIEFTTLKGKKHTADFVTLLPANEEFEQSMNQRWNEDACKVFYLGHGTTFLTVGNSEALFGSHTLKNGETQYNNFGSGDTEREIAPTAVTDAISRMNRFKNRLAIGGMEFQRHL